MAGVATTNPTCSSPDVTYDGFGNIKSKADVGNYTYSGANAGPHAVTQVVNPLTNVTSNYTYDANGNAITGDSRNFEYTSYDMASKITKGSDYVEFKYGPDRARWKRTDKKGSATTHTTYIGNIERIETVGMNVIEWKRYVGGAIFTYQTNMTNQVQASDKAYVYNDHLGSVDVITNAVGTITNRQSMSFDAWGSRRSGEDWSAMTAAQIQTALVPPGFSRPITTRGFTGHEMVDDMGIIHMNGRIYDAKIGRFLQADPFIQAATDTQSYNRYAYVRNNPLNATDPSGYSFKPLWNKIRPYVGAIAGIVVAVICQGGCTAQAYALYLGIAGAAGAAANGGNVFQGFVFGALSAGVGGIGSWQGFVARGIIGGIQGVASGGKFGNSFLAAGVGGMVGGGGNPYVGFIKAAVLGGVTSEITGGKFKNGAASAAFMYAVMSGVESLQNDGGSKEPDHISDNFKGSDRIKLKATPIEHPDGTIEYRLDLTYDNQGTVEDEVVDGWVKDIEKAFTRRFGKINKLTVTMTKFACDINCQIMGGPAEADIVFKTAPRGTVCENNAAACSAPGSGVIYTVANSYAVGDWYIDTPVHEFAHAIGFYHDRNETGSIRSYNRTVTRALTEKDFQIMSQFYFSKGY